MGVELFKREANLTIAPISGAEGIKIEGLRLAFKVERTSTSEGNKANIKIYNLAPNTRDRIQVKDQGVVLNAGYEDLVQRLFVGTIKRFERKREGVNTLTEIECKDGGLDLEVPEFSKSYSAGVPKRRIIDDIIAAMPHTGKGKLSSSGISGNISSKVSLTGTCKRVLDKLSRSWVFEWSIQDGNLQILDENTTSTTSAYAIVLRPDSGLIGVPVKTDRGCKFKSLMIPSIVPGCYVTIESEFLKGSYKAESVIHEGDTHGSEWTSETEARNI